MNKEKLKEYLRIKLDECELQIKKLKSKNKKIKIGYYTLIALSTIGNSTSIILTLLTGIPSFIITILSGISTITTTLSVKLNLENKKSKLEKKIMELIKIRNYIQYVDSSNGDLTEDKIREILQNV